MQRIGVLKNGGLKAAFASGLRVRTRVIAPCFVRLQGPPVVFSLSPPKGRAERQGVSPRPRRHVPEHMAPCARKAHGKTSHGSSNTPAFRTRMDFAACCMSQGLSLAPTRPRSCELSPGHALGPSARLAGVCPRPPSRISDPQRVRGPASWRPPHPAPRFEDDRHAPLIGTGWPINFPRTAKSSDGGTKSKEFVF